MNLTYFNFVLWLLAAFGSFVGMNEYEGPTTLVTQIIFYIFVAAFILWIWRLTIKAKKKGASLSKWSFIFFIIFFITQVYSSFLIREEPENIYNFGTKNNIKIVSQPIYMNENIYITDSYDDLLHSSSTNGMSKVFNSAGNFKRCIMTEDHDPIVARIGYEKLRNNFVITRTGHYTAKCIADTGFVVLQVDLKKDGNEWKIDRIRYSSSNPDTQEELMQINKKLGVDNK